jgi:two-component system alkaline phosphatase synthesis response regulator PhoP
MDVMLPVLNGFEAAEKIRQHNPKIPLIFLTARSDDTDKIKGLKTGAVDYVSKPFNLEELLLRIKIHLKTPVSEALNLFNIGDFQVNTETFEILHKNRIVAEIGKKELQLLQLLVENAGKVVSREQIMTKIWGTEVDTTSRTIDNYILTLRKLFQDDPKNPLYFHSIRGVGYKLTP